MNLTKEQIKKINEIYENAIDPNYNPSHPFLVLSDQAYPYLISTGDWSDFKNSLDQYYYGSEDDKVTLYEVLGVNNFEDVKKISPKDIIDKIREYDYEEGGDFLDYWRENTSDEIYKLIENEMDDEYLTEDDLNQIHDIIFNYSKKIKGDSKMKKDADPRLELVEKIKNYSNEYEVEKYNLEDDYFIYDENDYSFDTMNKEPFSKWLKDLMVDVLDPRERRELNKLIKDFNKENNIYPLNKIIEEFLYHFGFPGVPVLYANTVEGLKEAYKFVQETFDPTASVNDAQQKKICDSFNKRYN